MSCTQFVATASCAVVDGFNLESYLNAISERCVKEQNSIFDFYGEENGKVDVDFSQYVREQNEKILIECDTEESNGNSEVWEWLLDQFVPVMVSGLMEIKSATIDSRSGVDVNVFYLTKTGYVITTEQLLENYKSNVTEKFYQQLEKN
jgi:hypothetical protein